jgi:hypothetical protein
MANSSKVGMWLFFAVLPEWPDRPITQPPIKKRHLCPSTRLNGRSLQCVALFQAQVTRDNRSGWLPGGSNRTFGLIWQAVVPRT